MERILYGSEILQQQLERSLGLDKYARIMNSDPATQSFQRTFNAYYRVRRNSGWRRCFYDLFSKAYDAKYSFRQIITELYEATYRVEASFSSKMLATIDPTKPIWDQYVLKNLGKEFKVVKPEEKLEKSILLYEEIEDWYNIYLMTNEAKENIRIFDKMFPNYTWISSTKKIDCLLWCKH